jgi:aminopeptidase N
VRLRGTGSVLPTADPYLPGHGDPSWGADHYDLDLTYDVDLNRLSGRATIRGRAVEDLDRIVLDLAYLEVSKVTINGRPPAKYSQREHRLVVRTQEPLAAGDVFTLVVTYAGRPRPLIDSHQGDAGWEELSDGVIVAGQPHGAPTWFPCNDRPDDKASYSITVTTGAGYTVVANGVLSQRTRHASKVTWTHEQHEPMSTYLATVQIGRYDTLELGASVPIRLLVPSDAGHGVEAAFGRQAQMMEVFERLFGPYPFPEYTVVVTSDDLEIPLESQSLSTFGRNFLTADWEHVRLVAHELAHQWFGNSVTLRHWRDIWLHEGFACYAEWIWSEASGADSADTWARRHHRRLADLDQDLLLSDPGPELMFDDRLYKRGALTLHALRLRVGDDDIFFELLRSWVADHGGGSVTTADFVAWMTARTTVDLGELFHAWLMSEALPDLPSAS